MLQSGGMWVTVAIELKPRTGVVRFLPPHHSGPQLFSGPPRSERTHRGGISGSLRAQPRLQGSPHGSIALPRARWPTELFSPRASTPASGCTRPPSSSSSPTASSRRTVPSATTPAAAPPLPRRLLRREARLRRAHPPPQAADRARRPRRPLRRDRRRRVPGDLERRGLGQAGGRSSTPPPPRSPRASPPPGPRDHETQCRTNSDLTARPCRRRAALRHADRALARPRRPSWSRCWRRGRVRPRSTAPSAAAATPAASPSCSGRRGR